MKLRESSKDTKISVKNIVWIGMVHLLALYFGIFFFSWTGLIVYIISNFLVNMVGITFGFHRLLTHHSFKAAPFVEKFAALCGTLACQGGPISWVGQHRVHHAFSDRDEDPHNSKKGFWYSHIGFIFKRRQDLDIITEVAHYCPDVAKSKYNQFLENNMILLQFAFGILLFILGGVLFTPIFNWYMALSFIGWGIFIRLTLGYHITWLVNSATHKWGSRPNETTDASRNNWWVGILAFGEGWHNNHHAEPRSARHGWRWWQFDMTWLLIKTLHLFKLVDKIKLPSVQQKISVKKSIIQQTTPVIPRVKESTGV